jgi:hypothetical protein
MPKLYVNDVDMEALYGLWINAPEGWGDAPESRDSPVAVPGQAGGIIAVDEAAVATRTLSFTGQIIAPSGALMRSRWEAVKLLLGGPLIEIRTDAWPDRVALCRTQRIAWTRPPAGIEDAGSFRLDLLMPNPYFQARQFEVHAMSFDRPRPLALGSAPSPVGLNLYGTGGINPYVLYFDAQGIQRGKIGFEMTLALGEWIEVDGASGIALLHTGSGLVVTSATRYLMTDTRFFVADPSDGDATAGPMVQCFNCSGAAYVRKAYR